ncbi:hypothetical protein GPA10_24890 [Streptomyces sp. p1417]|uniref:Uncharacterized protein n=1 Tax=Streptomyces typhae TaxID=2681492 RepID=A0A6L6X258_9ACTN|nr:hypothetical protein [Streptomyces typhae]MVO87905.1 hypothetical protein [Streptomyces typhae]
MTNRIRLDDLTDDALDALYDNATRGWRRGDRWKERALEAEAALARVYEWADELDETARRVHPDAVHPVAAGLRHRINYDPIKESTRR